MDKELLRRKMINWRLTLGSTDRVRWSRRAQERLINSDWFREAGTILIYMAFRGEVRTQMIATAAGAAGKRLCLPRVQSRTRRLVLHAYSGDPTTLAEGAFGIREPAQDWPEVGFSEVDLVVAPGVAFDLGGYRLGYGGGYYDRTLVEVRAGNPAVRVVGLAYEFQVLGSLPVEEHDMRLDGLVTERALRSFRGGAD